MGKKHSLLKGGVLGAAAGFLAGILLAPKSGKETRKDIKKAAVKGKNEAEKELKKLYAELGHYTEKAKFEAASLKGQAKKELDALERAAQIVRVKVKEAITAIREGESDSKVIQETLKKADEAKKALQKKVK